MAEAALSQARLNAAADAADVVESVL
jgi:hypothetical protein